MHGWKDPSLWALVAWIVFIWNEWRRERAERHLLPGPDHRRRADPEPDTEVPRADRDAA